MINFAQLIAKSLRHYWRAHLAVAAGAAVGAAVLIGALLVGASMRSSMKDLALESLGRVDNAIRSDLFFREALADAFQDAAPVIVAEASVSNAATGAVAGKARVIGARETFWQIAAPAGATPKVSQDAPFSAAQWKELADTDAVLNEPLAREIGVQPGDDILLRVEKPSAIPRDYYLGDRKAAVATLRLRVARVIPAAGPGRFSLDPTQRYPMNIYVPLAALQRRLEKERAVNTILLPEGGPTPVEIQNTLKRHWRLEDIGLRFRATTDVLYLESDRIFLRETELGLPNPMLTGRELITAMPADSSLPWFQPVYAYLLNEIRLGERAIPYSMAVATSWGFDRKPFTGMENGMVLNEWAARQLHARFGDVLTLTYYVDGPAGQLIEQTTTQTLCGVLPMSDLRVRDDLIPRIPGVSDSEHIGDWDAPFPIDLKRIRPEDEAYWDQYRAAPKAFFLFDRAAKLWGARYGAATALAIARTRDNTVEALTQRILERASPYELGLRIEYVRKKALLTSGGSTDFASLFLGFSLFLLASAAMLIAMLFKLSLEGRAREFGLLLAVGYGPRRARRLLIAEGALVAAVGVAAGVILGIAYGAALIQGLRTWWVASIGAPFVRLHIDGASLAAGAIGGWLLALLSMWRSAARMAAAPPRALLAGGGVPAAAGWRSGWQWAAGALLVAAGAGAALWAPSQSGEGQAAAFFGAGAACLAGALLLFAAWLGRRGAPSAARLSLVRLGIASARRRPGPSVLVVGLMASASFLIVAVGANRKSPPDAADKNSGAGGFALICESPLPIYGPLDEKALGGAYAFPLRLRPGDDASCLNLYKAARPRILSVPEDLIHRGGFDFADYAALDEYTRANPWFLLWYGSDKKTPVFGDYATVVWRLHSGINKEILVGDQTLFFAALLRNSIFQSELLMAERFFLKLFPEQSGARVFLITPPRDGDVAALAARLESRYEEYGFDAVQTADRLAALMAVENSYLSAFQSLGALGLLLGTLGLSLALARNLIERRAEFALLRAVGYRFADLMWLAVSEAGWLLLVGLLAGAACALLPLAPAIRAGGGHIPWLGVSVSLAAIAVFGLAAAALCARAVLKAPALQTLREER